MRAGWDGSALATIFTTDEGRALDLQADQPVVVADEVKDELERS